MAEFETEHIERERTTTHKTFRDKFNNAKKRMKEVKAKIKDFKDRAKAKVKEYKDGYNKMLDEHHDNQIKRANQKIERLNKKVEVSRKLADAKKAKSQLKSEIAKDKIANLQSKTELKRAKQKYQVDKNANQRRYSNVAAKVIRGDNITPDELNSYKGDANKRINFHTMAKTTRDPVKKARYQLEADLNSHSPAVRAQAVQTYQTMMQDARTAKSEKLKDYQASRERKALLGKEAIKAAGIAAAAQALVGNDDDN